MTGHFAPLRAQLDELDKVAPRAADRLYYSPTPPSTVPDVASD